MSDITLAQALRQVKKLKGSLSDHLDRAKGSISFRLDNQPAFDFKASVEQAESFRVRLLDLESRIAVTNAVTSFQWHDSTVPLFRVVRELQELKSRISWVKALPVRARPQTFDAERDYGDDGKITTVKSEVRCDLPEADRASLLEKLQEEFDQLNDAVEKVNHATKLSQLSA